MDLGVYLVEEFFCGDTSSLMQGWKSFCMSNGSDGISQSLQFCYFNNI